MSPRGTINLGVVGTVILLLNATTLQSLAQEKPAEPATAAGYPPPGYRLAWSDEFNGDSLDTDEWACRGDSKVINMAPVS